MATANAPSTPAIPASTPEAPAAKPPVPFSERLRMRYRRACYRLLGQRYDQREGLDLLAERLQQAGIQETPGMFRAVSLVTALLACVGGFAGGFLLFVVALHVANGFLFVLIVTAVCVGAVFAGFQFVITSRISNRRSELDRELPFTLSELSVFASTGTSPIRLVHRMAERDHDPAMTGEFRRIVYKTDVQGKDLISALAETAKESPSTQVREAFWDLANMIHQGGNLDEYLRNKSDDVLKLKRLVQKEFIERLSTFLDMYVALVLVGVLMIAVGAFLLNAFGETAGGLDANQLLLLLTFGLVPLAVVMTIIMISIAYARAE